MKKIMLLATALLIITISQAQHKRSNDYKKGGKDTTWNNVLPKRTNISNGNILMHQETGKFKLYATYKKGKVTNWYAIDTKGNKIPATYSAKGAAVCMVCATLPNGFTNCYQISCDDLPKPKKDAVKTAH